MSSGAIPISDARELATKRKTPIVVIFAIEEGGDRYSLTTYGKTKKLCGWAAKVGHDIHQAVLDGTILDAAHADDPYAEIERLKAERDQYKEGEAALAVERDALWKRAGELEREVQNDST